MKNNEILIREYQIQDKKSLLEILKLNVPAYFAESEITDFENYLNNEAEKYFIAESDGKIIGAGGLNFENNYHTGKISWDFIHPDFHGKGIGTKLLKHRLNILKSMNSIEVIVVRTSQLAFRFYQKNGFVLKEVHKDYWAKGFDMYKMIHE